MGFLSKKRIMAAVVLLGAIATATTDYIRMLTVAAHHVEVLQAELETVLPVPGTDRVGVRRTHKSRFAAVRARYAGPVTGEQVFDYYRMVLAPAAWRPCGQSDRKQTYCRGGYEAIISVPSSDGPGSYSVTLQWDRITWPVWLAAVALIFAAAFSAGILFGKGRSLVGAIQCAFVPGCQSQSVSSDWRLELLHE